jgi:hypothetical protein
MCDGRGVFIRLRSKERIRDFPNFFYNQLFIYSICATFVYIRRAVNLIPQAKNEEV